MLEIEILREDLLAPLQSVIGAVERRQTMPMLANVLINVEQAQLTCIATDLEITLQAFADVETVNSGKAAIPARKLLDICKNLPANSMIKIDANDEKAILKAGRSRFTLACLAADEFPIPADIAGETNKFKIDSELFKKLIDDTAFSMANQDVRYYLNGMMVELSADSVKTVATDGHRLAFSEVADDFSIDTEKQVIVPRKGIVELQKLLGETSGEVEIILGSNHIEIKSGSKALQSKLIDGRFPDYNRVIPQNPQNTAIIDRMTLRESLQRAAILSNEKYRGIRLSLSENLLSLQAHNSEQEEAQEQIEIEYSGQEMEVGFNVQYLLDVTSALKNDDVQISINDPNSSALVEEAGGGRSKYVVMPMRL